MSTSNQQLSLGRLAHLISNDLRLYLNPILISVATIFGFLLLFRYHSGVTIPTYLFLLYVGGFAITSNAFKDLHDKTRAYTFLMVPCSNLERFLSKWLLTSTGYAIGLLLLCYLFSLFRVAAVSLISHQNVNSLNLLQPELWLSIVKYIILQAVVLLGAVTFKKYSLLKTILVIWVISVVFSFFYVLLGWALYNNYSPEEFSIVFQTTFSGWHFVFWTILAPFCWYMTYLRLTESELR